MSSYSEIDHKRLLALYMPMGSMQLRLIHFVETFTDATCGSKFMAIHMWVQHFEIPAREHSKYNWSGGDTVFFAPGQKSDSELKQELADNLDEIDLLNIGETTQKGSAKKDFENKEHDHWRISLMTQI